MSRVFIGLGTNLGDRAKNLEAARSALADEMTILKQSSFYETAPWGFLEQPAFLNQVIEAETDLSPSKLLDFLKKTETELGRQANFRYGPRLIDLDILFYGKRVIQTQRLQVPHPRLPERAFVLVPLVEIAPDWLHPQSKKTISELLALLPAEEREGVVRCG